MLGAMWVSILFSQKDGAAICINLLVWNFIFFFCACMLSIQYSQILNLPSALFLNALIAVLSVVVCLFDLWVKQQGAHRWHLIFRQEEVSTNVTEESVINRKCVCRRAN